MATSYRDYTVMTAPAPIGGQTILETLNILESFDLQSLGHNTVEYLHLLIECARYAFADRYRYMGDWEVAKVPIQGLLSKEYAKEIAQHVNLEKVAMEAELHEEPWVYYLERAVHDPWKHDPQPRPADASFSASADAGGTTHVNVADKDHNFVCCTHFCDDQWPTPPKTGVYLNGMMGQLIPIAGHPNSVEGWKRSLTNDSPILVLKDGSPVMCAGAPGGRRIINRVNQVFLNVAEFGMSIQGAITMPTVDASGSVNLVGSRLPRKVINGLRAMGHRMEMVDEGPYVGGFSNPHGILLDFDTGLLHGGVEVFGATTALGI